MDARSIKDAVDYVFHAAERRGWLERLPPFLEDYERQYPELLVFERHAAEIRAEVVALLGDRERLTNISALGADYTAGGIHTIRWKAYMLKCFRMVDGNAGRCPLTAELVRTTPGVVNAFFSILEPRQYIRPHTGYYKGFVRYHLGVVIPDGGENGRCWLRVNVDPADNAVRDLALVERGTRYFWQEGDGVIFDDTNLHDACNPTDEVRVVLWLDVKRRLPRALDAWNTLCLGVFGLSPFAASVRRRALVPTA
jgi:ornithine lipid ester-linked acyl 2-hydroxylase